jgi:hypothetical protein
MGRNQKHESNLTTTAPGSPRAPYLSKSKFLSGLQCPKLLWHGYNAKDRIPPPDAQTQAVFDQGHEVGSLAKKLTTRSIVGTLPFPIVVRSAFRSAVQCLSEL